MDQKFISEVAKAGINDRVKREWKQLFELLKEGFLDEKLVVPQSRFHNLETSLAPALKKWIVSYQNYLGQVDLQSPEHVKQVQTGRLLQRFLGANNEDPFGMEVAFRDAPDMRVQQFNITVDLDWSALGQRRGTTTAELEDIRQKCIADEVRYEEQLEKELGAERDQVKDTFLVGAAMTAEAGLQAFHGDRIYTKEAQQSVAVGLANIPARRRI